MRRAMLFYRRAIETLGSTLAEPASLAETVSALERRLCRDLALAAVRIELGARIAPAISDRFSVACDLVVDGDVLGSLSFAFFEEPGDRVRTDLRLLAPLVALALAWRAQSGERRRLNDLVRLDTLTHLPNRFAFDERLETVWLRSVAPPRTVALALLDIDFFKSYNDFYGHVAGDECLRVVARALDRSARAEGAFVSRYGGEEFAIIFEDRDCENALAALGRILEVFRTSPLPHEGSTLGRVTISAGLAAGAPGRGEPVEPFVRDADRELYRAKELGRNRIAFGTTVTAAPAAFARARSPIALPVIDGPTRDRDAEIAQIVAALRQSTLMTLVGPHGVGKSRLARVAGHAMQRYATGGVSFVDLEDATTEAMVLDGLEAALAGGAVSGSDRDVALVAAIREPESLLVLDNVGAAIRARVRRLCERLLETDGVRLLVTSDAALGIREERVVVIGPIVRDAVR